MVQWPVLSMVSAEWRLGFTHDVSDAVRICPQGWALGGYGVLAQVLAVLDPVRLLNVLRTFL
jgi:hypothetical protein